MTNPSNFPQGRLQSLDVYRGLTMVLLMAEAAAIYETLDHLFPMGHFLHPLVQQFHHHPWNGLRFWDLIQPFFMFIVGVAMPFSLAARRKKGFTWRESFKHILYRCFMLFLFGTGLHCVYSGQLVWELWNVLTQLSFTILLTFLILNWDWKKQLGVAFICLGLTELFYRSYAPGAPFVMDQNFGSWMDLLLMGKINDGGGWVTINCLPTAAHTIWGAMAGNLLRSNKLPFEKLKNLCIAGAIILALGYGLDWTSITPIVKRIATTSFVFASGGWCLLALAFFYWLVDFKEVKNWATFAVIVGMNPIFIYLFFETIGVQWLRGFGKIFSYGVFENFGFSPEVLAVINAFFVWGILWYICYFLYKNKVFIKI